MSLFKKKRTYLDWAASAPVSPYARRAFDRALKESGNPSSPHTEGVTAKNLLEKARTEIARLVEVKPTGVVFTSGATEANNLAVTGTVMRAKKAGTPVHVLYLSSCHASVIQTLASLKSWGVEAEPLVVTDGAIDLERLRAQIRKDTCLVVMDVVCGETGTRWDVRAVRTVLDAYEHEHGSRPLLHADASQAPLAESFSLTHLTSDSLSLDAQKIGGIRGVGALCIRANVSLEPVLHGGGQEGGLRPGTEPVALIAAFSAALSSAETLRKGFAERATKDRERLLAFLPDVPVNQGKKGVSHILNLSFPGTDTDYAVMLLDRAGFAVSTKSACETDSESGSRAVMLLTHDEERAKATLRISWGPDTRPADLHRFARALTRTLEFLQRH